MFSFSCNKQKWSFNVLHIALGAGWSEPSQSGLLWFDVTTGRRDTKVCHLQRAAGFKTPPWSMTGSLRCPGVSGRLSPNSQPFTRSLKDSAAHSRDFTSATMWSTPHATSITWPGTVTWQNITQRSTKLEGKQLSIPSPQPAPIIGCMVWTLLFAWLILYQCFLTRHGKNWSSLLPMPKQPLTFFPQTKSSPRSAKQPSNSHFRQDRGFLLIKGLR